LYEIEEHIPHVKAFPTDKKVRVVWAYGTLILNHDGESNIPLVEILLKEIKDNEILLDTSLVIKIKIAEIDIVRLGTVWCNRQRLNSKWTVFEDYKEDMEFQFDFSLNSPESIKFIDKDPKTNAQYFPFQKYNLGNLQNNYGYKYHFTNAIYTKLTTNSGTTVLIHSLEFLTSTYVPEEKTIRYRLLNEPMDMILNDYLENDTYVENNEYHMHFKQNKRLSNMMFLSYLKFNEVTRNRLSKLRTSLETGSKFPDRYPIVLPYHPTRMKITADGIWLNADTFFVLRITGCSLPSDNKIIVKQTKYNPVDKKVATTEESDETDQEGKKIPPNDDDEDKEDQNNPPKIDPAEIGIDSGSRPNPRNPSLQIISEVAILNTDDVDITYTEEVKTKDRYIYDPTTKIKPKEDLDNQDETKNSKDNDERSKIDIASAGQSSQSAQNKNITSIALINDIEQSEILTSVVEALKKMKEKQDIVDPENKAYIDDLFFLNTVCQESDTDKRPKFYDMISSDKKMKKSWCMIKKIEEGKDTLEGFRRFMLIKIVLSDGKYTYLLEIDRAKEADAYSGVIFSNGKKLDRIELQTLTNKIISNKGIYSKLNKDKKAFEEIKLPVKFQMIFEHRKIQNSMYEKMKKVMNDAYIRGAFI